MKKVTAILAILVGFTMNAQIRYGEMLVPAPNGVDDV